MTVRFLAVLGDGPRDPDQPVARADDPGLTRGDGCFEGCRLVVDAAGTGSVDKLEAHLDRFARSAAALQISFDRTAWLSFVTRCVADWHTPGEFGLRLTLTRGVETSGIQTPLGMATIADLPAHYPRQRRDGLRVLTLSRGTTHDAFADAPWLLGGVKTLSYAVNMAAQREAERHGCDDVIFVSSDGAVLEAPTSSVVWATGRDLHTIAVGANGILGGTTQQLLFERATAAGWHTQAGDARLADLQAAEVLWLIGSVRGPVDVVELDGRPRTRRPEIDAEIRALAGFPPPGE